jgi:SWI/SNF related-matrix-associated actin-dependent regulator of chromatin subfamily C
MQVDEQPAGEASSADKPEESSAAAATATTDDKAADGMDVDPTAETAPAPAAPAEATAPDSAAVNGSSTISHSEVERVATLALGSAAAKASVLATHEERRIESLVTRLVSAQMKKLELKMSMFEKFEDMLEQEKRQIEVQKQQFYKEKLTLQGQLSLVQDMLNKAKSAGQPINGDVKSRAEAVERAISTSSATAMRETPLEGNGGSVEVPQEGQSTLATIG